MSSNKGIVNNEESLIAKLEEIRAAQVKFAEYTQEQVDKIFLALPRLQTTRGCRSQRWRTKRREWA